MELGIITDEVHTDFERACAEVAGWGLTLAEVRNVNGTNVARLSDDEARSAAAAVRRNGLRVSAVASPVFKSPLDGRPVDSAALDFVVPGTETVAAQLELLERSCALARLFETRFVRVFTFLRVAWSDDVIDQVIEHMIDAAEIAARNDVVLAVENEPACIVGTGRELGAFFARLDAALDPRLRAHVGALWDPGNALSIGEDRPYPGGYDALNVERLVHVHLKDLGSEPGAFGTFVPLGEGRIDYRGQFDALRRDGYKGSVVLEPHYAPAGIDPVTAAKTCVDAARKVLAGQ